MDFYEVIDRRRTVRDFKDVPVDRKTLEKIIETGMKAPSNDHKRNWEFIILSTPKEKEEGLKYVKQWAERQREAKMTGGDDPRQQMYAYAIPRQYSMLADAPYVVIPFFKAAPAFFNPTAINSYNSFASIWAVIENIFLAAAREGLATSLRIPVGTEGKSVARDLGAPEGYVMACYIGIGYARDDTRTLVQYDIDPKDRMHQGRW